MAHGAAQASVHSNEPGTVQGPIQPVYSGRFKLVVKRQGKGCLMLDCSSARAGRHGEAGFAASPVQMAASGDTFKRQRETLFAPTSAQRARV